MAGLNLFEIVESLHLLKHKSKSGIFVSFGIPASSVLIPELLSQRKWLFPSSRENQLDLFDIMRSVSFSLIHNTRRRRPLLNESFCSDNYESLNKTTEGQILTK